MGYVLMAKDFIKNKGCAKEYHLFGAKIESENYDNSINIKLLNEYSMCSEEANKIKFNNLKKYSFTANNNTYYHYHLDDYKIYYYNDYKTAMISIAVYINKKACGVCMSSLYN
ncbi:hypothetical protein R4J03_01195 [Brachyspira intermedia]|uniref:hypothetical protein n=1 Tax=Brachyspira intermedia TaxID=84377 RepID=UPI003003F9DF